MMMASRAPRPGPLVSTGPWAWRSGEHVLTTATDLPRFLPHSELTSEPRTEPPRALPSWSPPLSSHTGFLAVPKHQAFPHHGALPLAVPSVPECPFCSCPWGLLPPSPAPCSDGTLAVGSFLTSLLEYKLPTPSTTPTSLSSFSVSLCGPYGHLLLL